ncbi:GlxA family transcriptional regulator [Pseudomaricurvus hydrocarbonicus]
MLILAIPETAGSALYGMVDVLNAAGNLWQTLVRSDAGFNPFEVNIVSSQKQVFSCGNRIPVMPDCAIDTAADADIIILPELWLGPDQSIKGRYPQIMDWLRQHYQQGGFIYSACSGSIMLAESGLLDGCSATSHWGYQDLFKQQYPLVKFTPGPNLVFADANGRIVTAGGTTSWHDLAIHIISRHVSTGEAVRIAKVYLLKWHGEGQLPYASLNLNVLHNDSVVKKCEQWLKDHYREKDALPKVLLYAKLPERTLKRRFKAATGHSLVTYIQNLRIEEAKQLLESTQLTTDDISVQISYEDTSFFRRLFKRLTGLSPSQYRRMFQPLSALGKDQGK